MSQKMVRMHIPSLGGAQNVNASDVELWEKKGGMVLPDLTPEEIADAAAKQKAEAESHATAEAAQQAANALALKEVEDQLKAKSEVAPTAIDAPKVVAPSTKTKPATPTES